MASKKDVAKATAVGAGVGGAAGAGVRCFQTGSRAALCAGIRLDSACIPHLSLSTIPQL